MYEEGERETYRKELGHAVLEIEKFQDLWSSSGRPRRANDVVPVQIQMPENQET